MTHLTTQIRFAACCCAFLSLLMPARSQNQPLKREAHTPKGQYRFAEGLLVRKHYDMAEVEFRYFLDKNSEHELAPQAMFRLIECLRQQAKDRDTLSTINRFQARWPKHELTPKLFLWKGELLLREGKVSQAASCFKRLLLSSDTVTQEAAIYFLAQSQAKTGQAELALKTYAKIAGKPFDANHLYRPYALFALAAANQHRGDFASAGKSFQRLKNGNPVPPGLREEAIYRLGENRFLRGDFAPAIELYELLLVDFPNGVFAREARKRRTWSYFALKNYPKAIELAKDWCRRYENIFDYEMDYIHGASLAGASFFSEALPFFVKLASNAMVPKEYVILARYQEIYCLLRLERYAETIARAEAFCHDYPKSGEVADVHYFAGEALFRTEACDKAVAEFRRAIDTFVGEWTYYADANFRLAECLEKVGKLKEAAKVYRNLALSPQIKQPAYVLLRAGEYERKAGDAKAAVADFAGLLEKFPGKEPEAKAAMMHLSELYSQLGQYDRAVSLVEKLLARKEKDGRARLLFFLGYVYFQQEKYAEAEKRMRQAIAEDRGGKIANNAKYYLAGALLEQKHDDEALVIFGELLMQPVENRPSFEQSLLFRLEELFFTRHQYDVSETICRWLLTWKDSAVKYRASLRLSQILVAQSKLAEAQRLLEGIFALKGGEKAVSPDDFSREEILSLLGEVFLLLNKNDRAVGAFEKCLAKPGLGMEYATRARWGLADILKREKRYRQALHYAENALVLSDDPIYTPRSMLLAVEILVELGKVEQAQTTWKELLERYPSFAEQQRRNAVVKKLLSVYRTAEAAGKSGAP